MLLGNCKAKIKKVSTAFAIALMSARLEQTVCYKLLAVHSFTMLACLHIQKQILLNTFCLNLVCCRR